MNSELWKHSKLFSNLAAEFFVHLVALLKSYQHECVTMQFFPIQNYRHVDTWCYLWTVKRNRSSWDDSFSYVICIHAFKRTYTLMWWLNTIPLRLRNNLRKDKEFWIFSPTLTVTCPIRATVTPCLPATSHHQVYQSLSKLSAATKSTSSHAMYLSAAQLNWTFCNL